MSDAKPPVASMPVSAPAIALLGISIGLQVVMPLCHFVIPSNVHWTEEGDDFAWAHEARHKAAVADPRSSWTGRQLEIRANDYMTSRQKSNVASRQYLMVQHGEVLEGQFEDFGYEQSEAYVNEWASLNRREVQRFIDPTVDLATASIPSFGAADWILPFGEHSALL